MPGRPVRLAARPADAAEVAAGLESLRAEVGVVRDWPADALAEAEHAARTGAAPDAAARSELRDRADRTDVPFVTVDPAGSTDLDQAVHVARRGTGWRVRYAIADVASFVRPGGALDLATHERGSTVYAPDGRVPLHPEVLSDGAASLLAGQVRPAVLWQVDLDADGEPVDVQVERATVRSRAQLTYEGAQRALDDGTADEVLAGVRAVGLLREERERARGGVSLDVPEQEVVPDPAGGWSLRFRRTLPVEGWNAQVSLLTGAVAARVMLDAGVGVLRTLPPADDRDVARLRRTASRGTTTSRTATCSRAWTRRWERTRRSCTRRRRCSAGRRTWPSAAATTRRRLRARTPSTPRSGSRTRTSPRRCGVSSTGTAPRCAWRQQPVGRCPPGSVRRCRRCPRPWPGPGGA